ncbi:hypothetical protein [Myxococcus virescens]|uniref:Uncharacterized protein n=1 Tax=Myxococcus virescens TaxID=83456 RepID=A0A511HPK6_9BACT|nr:hypothetical protein [Myxococcus virescens]GEL75518.1 hypothetical protein MVI01_73020 [Myxococcus virescens]SDD65709.1 hypothetical protein SAMN04488504_102152 [Myxococcus virescens]
MHTGYVRLTAGALAGDFAVQLPADNQWGFDLHRAQGEDSQTWSGGVGLASEWEAVSRQAVPEDVRAEMDWLFTASDTHNVCAGCGEVFARAELTANAVGQDFCRRCTEQAAREDDVAREEESATLAAEQARREAEQERE